MKFAEPHEAVRGEPTEPAPLPTGDVKYFLAVTVVAADTLPAVATIFPVAALIFPVVDVIPVPAVTVVPAETLVPAVTVVAADTLPACAAMLPKTAVIFPAVVVISPRVYTGGPISWRSTAPSLASVVLSRKAGLSVLKGANSEQLGSMNPLMNVLESITPTRYV